jgi:hypothetical protein
MDTLSYPKWDLSLEHGTQMDKSRQYYLKPQRCCEYLNFSILFNIVFKHPVAFIYTSYILKYTVLNATSSFSFLFILRHVSAALGHHQVFCCQSCLTVIYIEHQTCIRNNDGYYGHNNNGEEGQTFKYTGKVPHIQNQQRKPAHEWHTYRHTQSYIWSTIRDLHKITVHPLLSPFHLNMA